MLFSEVWEILHFIGPGEGEKLVYRDGLIGSAGLPKKNWPLVPPPWFGEGAARNWFAPGTSGLNIGLAWLDRLICSNYP